jgi:hypothetical protein
MPTRKYRERGDKQPVVKEAKAQPYARENAAGIALSIASVKRKLKKPFRRSTKDIAWALEIAGIGEGPEDLSARAREYLYDDK